MKPVVPVERSPESLAAVPALLRPENKPFSDLQTLRLAPDQRSGCISFQWRAGTLWQ